MIFSWHLIGLYYTLLEKFHFNIWESEKMILELSCIFLWQETHSSFLGQWHYMLQLTKARCTSGRRGELWWHSFLYLFRGVELATASVLLHWINEFKMLWPHPGLVVWIIQFRPCAQNWKDVRLTWAHRMWPNPLPMCSLQRQQEKHTRRKGRPMLFERVFFYSLVHLWKMWGPN